MKSLKGKTALITGGARRIGRAIVLALAEEGANVVIHYYASKSHALELAGLARKNGVKTWTIHADLGDPVQAETLFERTRKEAGHVDFLINNAAVYPENHLRAFSVKDLSVAMNINALAPLLISRSFAEREKRGAILNFLDTRILKYDHHHAAYHVAKRMLLTLTKMMALEFAPRFRVNAVAPGPVLPPRGAGRRYLRELVHANVMNRTARIADVTQAALYLLKAEFVTGQVLYVDGGTHLKESLYGAG